MSRCAELEAENARLREAAGKAQRWLLKLHNADLDQDAADAVTVGMVFQKDAMRLASELGKVLEDSETG